MNLQDEFKLSLEIELSKLMRKHFSCYIKLSQANFENTKDLWEEMKLLDKKFKKNLEYIRIFNFDKIQ